MSMFGTQLQAGEDFGQFIFRFVI